MIADPDTLLIALYVEPTDRIIMYGKDGLPYELGAIQELWRTRQHFALHHDLTNCLRIADLTEFTADGKRLFHEIKAKAPHREEAVGTSAGSS